MTFFRIVSDGIKSDNDERMRIILLNGGSLNVERLMKVFLNG